MPEKTTIKKLLRYNYRQIIIVFVSFAFMALAAYFFIGRILRDRLLEGAETLISSAEANVQSGLVEVETTLLNTANTVQNLIRRNAAKQQILDYLTNTTEWIRAQEMRLFGVNGVYAYINGEFYDSIGLNPGDDYIPQRRPWYQTAVRSGQAVAYTAPYEDAATGETVISAVRTINGNDGYMMGIITVDINIGWLNEYIKSFELAPGGYSMLLGQNMTLIIYPDDKYIGSQFSSLKGSYEEIEMELRKTANISAKRITDTDNKKVIVFFRKVFNGWYIGSVTPYFTFYRDLYIAALILAFLWITFSLLVCFILLRFSAKKLRADEQVMDLQDALLKTMAEMINCRDDITGGHIERTQRLLKIMVEEIEKSGVYHEESKHWNKKLLYQSCQLHDVGKVSIEDSILKKKGKLTVEEFEEMKKHTTFGEQLIEKIETKTMENDFLNYAKIFAASHHEKWDGTGYPRGLKGQEIPLIGRIMAIADVYDALTSERPYKKPFTHEEAVKIIAENSGTHFDPFIIELFSDKFKE
jgi:amino acid permease